MPAANRKHPGSGATSSDTAGASYISAPLGLAHHYTLAITDDLHKRLGELRHQQSNTDALSGEMFIRYLGSNLTIKVTAMSVSTVMISISITAPFNWAATCYAGMACVTACAAASYTRGNTRIRPHAADGYSSTTFDSDSLALYTTGSVTVSIWTVRWPGTGIAVKPISPVKKRQDQQRDGWTASLESGYSLTFANGLRLEPQAQLTYLNLKMDDFTDSDRTRVAWDAYASKPSDVWARVWIAYCRMTVSVSTRLISALTIITAGVERRR
ncbi:autotransporter outer membrane beta-barrel domain-containing protein [Pantoea sp. LMR881]|uniref:autotransporter outer membrane beta-barrel domain-containing protein n=1 Tax=Pantoea sp. LMR881 TaxID=3014336 RepID=UPI0022B04B7A|nr:autotransporter outer membrane beta-barrel domain-containing protein [Pantoea sp. LMR881]MCZ4061491.1 autotransporter outer membrane beta-barrel domain-containing protein [Pantoea sp. LMR881]